MSQEAVDALVVIPVPFLTDFIKAMVDVPDAVRVEPIHKAAEVCLRLTADRKDIEKVIGRQGRTGRSIRVSWHD
jgi:predicted RNA-binding protein YlqC (UPF0109 family)